MTGIGSEGEGGASIPTAACKVQSENIEIEAAATSREVCGSFWGRGNCCVKIVALSCGSHCKIALYIHPERGVNNVIYICISKGYAAYIHQCFFQLASCCFASFVFLRVLLCEWQLTKLIPKEDFTDANDDTSPTSPIL